MFIQLVSRCRFPVQCTVSASVNLSAGDQMLKYGSHATSGTDGGRKVGGGSAAPSARATKVKKNKRSCFMLRRRCRMVPAGIPISTDLRVILAHSRRFARAIRQ